MLSDYQWITVGEISGLFDLNRDTLDWLGLSDVTPLIEITGEVTMTFRMLEEPKSCSTLSISTLDTHQERFRIALIDVDIDLPTGQIGFWTTGSGGNRLEVVDFLRQTRRVPD